LDALPGRQRVHGPDGPLRARLGSGPKSSSAGAGNLLDDLSAELAPLAEIASDTPRARPQRRAAAAALPARRPAHRAGTLTLSQQKEGLDPGSVTLGDPLGIAGATAEIDDRGVITTTVRAAIYGPPVEPGPLTMPIDLSGQSARCVRPRLYATGNDAGADLPLRTGPADACRGTAQRASTLTLSPKPADLQVTASSQAVRDGVYMAE
jgi:hypothetical protein